MIGRNFIIKTTEYFSERNAKKFCYREFAKKRNDFIQFLWRQWPWFRIKIHPTS